MFGQVSALLYLETRQIVNFARGAVRNPSRITVWVLLIAWAGFTIFSRAQSTTLAPQLGHTGAIPAILGYGALLLLFTALLQGANGRVSTFANAADARFIIGSRLSPRLVIFWLQIRNSAAMLLRFSLVILVNVVFFSHGNGAKTFLAIAGLTALFTVTPLPVFEVARRVPARIVTLGATILVILCFMAAAVAAASLAISQLAPAMTIIDNTGVGMAAASLWNGSTLAISMLWLCVMAFLVAGEFGATDLYPELYASTLTWAARWSRARGHGHLNRPKAGIEVVRSLSTPLRGVMVAFWKEQLAYMRSPGVRSVFFVELGVAVIAGFAAGIYGRHDKDMLISIAGAAVAIIVMLLAVSGTSLVHDISKPIWWLGTGSTLARLTAWSVATSLDSIIILMVGSISIGIASGQQEFTIIGVIMALIIPSFVRAIGVATYAFLPAAIDQRGPVAIIRALMLYVLFAPPIALGIFAAFTFKQALLGFVVALISTCIEGMLALVVAAWKIEGRGAEYATAEIS